MDWKGGRMTGVRGMKDGKQKDVEMRDLYMLKKNRGGSKQKGE